MKIYLPKTINDNQCATVIDKDTIRVYEEKPVLNSDINYTDYYINSNYLSKVGHATLEDVPDCLQTENFTTSYYYRNDFHNILIIFFILIFIVYFIFSKILHAFFLGFRR